MTICDWPIKVMGRESGHGYREGVAVGVAKGTGGAVGMATGGGMVISMWVNIPECIA